jgi:hypothetical protein
MYIGYVFLCDDASLQKCLASKNYSCVGEAAKTAEEVQEGAVVFLYDSKRDTVTGPFTASGVSTSELEPGAWATSVDLKNVAANIRVTWESLHEAGKAASRFPFLKETKDCRLTQLQTQELLNQLKEAPELRL